MQLLLDYLGRVHPLVIHLPITLIILGGVIEVCRIKRDSLFLSQAEVWTFGLGAVGAILAAASGWLLAAHGHHSADEKRYVELHRWFGLGTSVMTLLGWVAARRWAASTNTGRLWLRRTFAWSASGLTIVAGHLGAVIVWGADWFS